MRLPASVPRTQRADGTVNQKNRRSLLSLAASAAAVNYGADDYESLFGSGGLLRPCEPFSCPGLQEMAQKRPMILEAQGGCNKMKGGEGAGQMLNQLNHRVKDDSPIQECCVLRQACGMICGASHTFCDQQLSQCMKDQCEDAEDEETCAKDIKSIEESIEEDGGRCQQHAKIQQGVCQCVEPEFIVDKRTRILKDTYKRHAKANLHKVDALMAKADTTKKMATIVARLVSKYPKMVRLVKDPEEEYEEAMRKMYSKTEAKNTGGQEDAHDPDYHTEL